MAKRLKWDWAKYLGRLKDIGQTERHWSDIQN